MTWPRTIKKGNASVKIYRVKHATNRGGFAYVLAWATAEGRKTQKFSDEAKALDEAGLKANQLNAGRIEASEMTAEDRQELQAAREIAGDVPLLTALREWKTAREREQGPTHKTTVAGAIEQFYAHKKSVGVNVKAGYSRTFPGFAKHFQDRTLASIGLIELDADLGQFTNAGSRNSHRRRVVTLFRWCRKRGLLPLDAVTVAERTDTARQKREKIGLITPADLARCYAEVRRAMPEYLPALTLAAACGIRRAEVHGQLWEDIDLDRKLLKVSEAKPNTPAWRLVPITEPAIVELAKHRPENGKGPVCTNLAVDRIRDICRTAELRLAPNGFRHTWISARVAVTGNVSETSLEAGNSPRVLHRHYRELMRKDEAEAWFALPSAPSP
jgi:integrase